VFKGFTAVVTLTEGYSFCVLANAILLFIQQGCIKLIKIDS